MNIKKNDTVIVLSGKDKGKTGKVLRAFPRQDMVIVAGVNIRKVHKKATQANQKGQMVDQTAPIHVSNVSILDAKSGKGTRVGHSMKGEKKIRITKKGNTEL